MKGEVYRRIFGTNTDTRHSMLIKEDFSFEMLEVRVYAAQLLKKANKINLMNIA